MSLRHPFHASLAISPAGVFGRVLGKTDQSEENSTGDKRFESERGAAQEDGQKSKDAE